MDRDLPLKDMFLLTKHSMSVDLIRNQKKNTESIDSAHAIIVQLNVDKNVLEPTH